MNYPLPSRSEEDHWPMSHGLVEDVAEALFRHGYPRVTKSPEGAADFVRLRQHVWHFITDLECDVLAVPAVAEPGEADRADDELRSELAEKVERALFYTDVRGARVFLFADPRVVVGVDPYIGQAVDAVVSALLGAADEPTTGGGSDD